MTATLSQGRLIQFGPTPKVYHGPSSLNSARVFSDPPLNELTVIKQDSSLLSARTSSSRPLAFRVNCLRHLQARFPR